MVPSNRTRGNGHKLKQRKFQLNPRKNFFPLRVTEPCPRLPREAVESPSLEIFQPCLAAVLCSLLWVTLLRQGVGLGDPQRSLPTPTSLGFCQGPFPSRSLEVVTPAVGSRGSAGDCSPSPGRGKAVRPWEQDQHPRLPHGPGCSVPGVRTGQGHRAAPQAEGTTDPLRASEPPDPPRGTVRVRLFRAGEGNQRGAGEGEQGQ